MLYTPAPIHHHYPLNITPWSEESIGIYLAAIASSSPTSGTGTVADLVYYVPFEIAVLFIVKEVGWQNGTIVGNGNAQVGVYREDGTQIVECTATTTTGTSQRQTIEITDTTLGRGRYYAAFRASSGTDRFERIIPAAGLLEAAGIMQEASQTDLPATATFAAMATAYLPAFYLAGHTLA
jgi:hypothetical protein